MTAAAIEAEFQKLFESLSSKEKTKNHFLKKKMLEIRTKLFELQSLLGKSHERNEK